MKDTKNLKACSNNESNNHNTENILYQSNIYHQECQDSIKESLNYTNTDDILDKDCSDLKNISNQENTLGHYIKIPNDQVTWQDCKRDLLAYLDLTKEKRLIISPDQSTFYPAIREGNEIYFYGNWEVITKNNPCKDRHFTPNPVKLNFKDFFYLPNQGVYQTGGDPDANGAGKHNHNKGHKIISEYDTGTIESQLLKIKKRESISGIKTTNIFSGSKSVHSITIFNDYITAELLETYRAREILLQKSDPMLILRSQKYRITGFQNKDKGYYQETLNLGKAYSEHEILEGQKRGFNEYKWKFPNSLDDQQIKNLRKIIKVVNNLSENEQNDIIRELLKYDLDTNVLNSIKNSLNQNNLDIELTPNLIKSSTKQRNKTTKKPLNKSSQEVKKLDIKLENIPNSVNQIIDNILLTIREKQPNDNTYDYYRDLVWSLINYLEKNTKLELRVIQDFITQKMLKHSPLIPDYWYKLPYGYNPNRTAPSLKTSIENLAVKDIDPCQFINYSLDERLRLNPKSLEKIQNLDNKDYLLSEIHKNKIKIMSPLGLVDELKNQGFLVFTYIYTDNLANQLQDLNLSKLAVITDCLNDYDITRLKYLKNTKAINYKQFLIKKSEEKCYNNLDTAIKDSPKIKNLAKINMIKKYLKDLDNQYILKIDNPNETNIIINERFLGDSEVLKTLDYNNAIVFVNSAMNTGKTTFLQYLQSKLDKKTTNNIGNRIRLNDKLNQKLNTITLDRFDLFDSKIQGKAGANTCIDSIDKFDIPQRSGKLKNSLIVMDEGDQTIETLLQGNTEIKNNRTEKYKILLNTLEDADCVICLSANLASSHKELLTKFTNKRVININNTYQENNRDLYLYDKIENTIQKLIESVKNAEDIAVFSDSATFLTSLEKKLDSMVKDPNKIELFTSQTFNDNQDLNKYITNPDELKYLQITLGSPSIQSGLSIENSKVTKVFYLGFGVIRPMTVSQILLRIRNNCDRYVYIPDYGINKSNLREIKDILESKELGLEYLENIQNSFINEKWYLNKDEIIKKISDCADLFNNVVRGDTSDKEKHFIYKIAELKSTINKENAIYKEACYHVLKNYAKYNIINVNNKLESEQLLTVNETLKELKEITLKDKLDYSKLVMDSDDLTKSDYEKIKDSKDKTTSQRAKLEKYYLNNIKIPNFKLDADRHCFLYTLNQNQLNSIESLFFHSVESLQIFRDAVTIKNLPEHYNTKNSAFTNIFDVRLYKNKQCIYELIKPLLYDDHITDLKILNILRTPSLNRLLRKVDIKVSTKPTLYLKSINAILKIFGLQLNRDKKYLKIGFIPITKYDKFDNFSYLKDDLNSLHLELFKTYFTKYISTIYKADKFIKDNDQGILRLKDLFSHLLKTELTLNENELIKELRKNSECELIDITTYDDNDVAQITENENQNNINNDDDNDSVNLTSLELLDLDSGIVNLSSENLILAKQLLESFKTKPKQLKLDTAKNSNLDKPKQIFLDKLREKIKMISSNEQIPQSMPALVSLTNEQLPQSMPALVSLTNEQLPQSMPALVSLTSEQSTQSMPARSKLIKYKGDFWLYLGIQNNKHIIYNTDSNEYQYLKLDYDLKVA